jgi:hypothetical protein
VDGADHRSGNTDDNGRRCAKTEDPYPELIKLRRSAFSAGKLPNSLAIHIIGFAGLMQTGGLAGVTYF